MKNTDAHISNKASMIKLVATDCDGVLTDGGMYYTEDGKEIKRFCSVDGVGFNLLHDAGIKIAIITGECNDTVKQRAEKLKVDYLITGRSDKLTALNEICKSMEINISQAAYLGDDLYDAPALKACGLGFAPSDAHISAKKAADIVTEHSGGFGCFREAADIIVENK
jgi:YrbI family 3-deoxy-D-manno-octulosonate 8-phosphate phosphatase